MKVFTHAGARLSSTAYVRTAEGRPLSTRRHSSTYTAGTRPQQRSYSSSSGTKSGSQFSKVELLRAFSKWSKQAVKFGKELNRIRNGDYTGFAKQLGAKKSKSDEKKATLAEKLARAFLVSFTKAFSGKSLDEELQAFMSKAQSKIEEGAREKAERIVEEAEATEKEKEKGITVIEEKEEEEEEEEKDDTDSDEKEEQEKDDTDSDEKEEQEKDDTDSDEKEEQEKEQEREESPDFEDPVLEGFDQLLDATLQTVSNGDEEEERDEEEITQEGGDLSESAMDVVNHYGIPTFIEVGNAALKLLEHPSTAHVSETNLSTMHCMLAELLKPKNTSSSKQIVTAKEEETNSELEISTFFILAATAIFTAVIVCLFVIAANALKVIDITLDTSSIGKQP